MVLYGFIMMLLIIVFAIVEYGALLEPVTTVGVVPPKSVNSAIQIETLSMVPVDETVVLK